MTTKKKDEGDMCTLEYLAPGQSTRVCDEYSWFIELLIPGEEGAGRGGEGAAQIRANLTYSTSISIPINMYVCISVSVLVDSGPAYNNC